MKSQDIAEVTKDFMYPAQRRFATAICLFSSTLLAHSAVPTTVENSQPVRPRQSWEVTLTLVRAMDLLPQAAAPVAKAMASAAATSNSTLKPVREANDADTIQTVPRRRPQVQVAALNTATTSSALLHDYEGIQLAALTDANDSIYIPDNASATPLPTLTGDATMTDLIHRQVVMKLAIVLYRQELGRYPEGLDALTMGRKNYFQSALGLLPATSRYAELAKAAGTDKGMPGPAGIKWAYNVSADGEVYVLGVAGNGAAGINPKEPLVSNLLGTGELPILPGTTASYVVREFQQYVAKHQKPS